jgi:hypothetical protein
MFDWLNRTSFSNGKRLSATSSESKDKKISEIIKG